MTISIDDLERKFYQEDYAPGLSTRQVVERTNLAKNPSFINNYNDYTLSRATVVSRSNGELEIAGTDAVNNDSFIRLGGANITNDLYGLTPGKTYTASYTIRLPAALAGSLDGRSRQLIIYKWTNLSSPLQLSPGSSSVIPNAAGTYRGFVTFTIPLDSTSIDIRFYHGGLSSAGSVFFSKVLIEETSSVGTYFDGDTADFNNGNYVWSGTPHASTSKLLVPEPVLAENFVLNPGLYSNLNYWTFRGGTDIPVDGVTKDRINVNWSKSGYALRLNGSATSSNIHVEVAFLNKSGTGSYYPQPLKKLGGRVVYVSCKAASSKKRIVRIRMRPDDLSGDQYGPDTLITSEATEVVGTFNLPSTTDYATFTLFYGDGTSFTVGDTVDISDAYVSFMDSDFDGNSSNSFWTGTPGNSISRLIDINSRDHSFLEHSYWAKRSGLTPKAQYSLADHQRAALIAEHDPIVGDSSVVVAKNLLHMTTGISNWQSNSGTITAGNGTFIDFTSNGGSSAGILVGGNQIKSCKPGDTFSVSAVITSPVAVSYTPIIDFFTAQGGSRVLITSTLFNIPANTPTKVTHTGVCPEGATVVLTKFYSAGTAPVNGTVINLKDIILVKDSSLPSFFNGNSSYARWLGTPLESESELTDPTKNSSGDLLLSRYQRLSGLPIVGNSAADHEMKYYKTQLGL